MRYYRPRMDDGHPVEVYLPTFNGGVLSLQILW